MAQFSASSSCNFPETNLIDSRIYLHSITDCSPGIIASFPFHFYLGEVADLAGRVIKSCKLKTVTPRAIMLAVRQDDELFKVGSEK